MNPKSVSIPYQSQRIADFYHAATVKGAWYGPSLGDLLDQVTRRSLQDFLNLWKDADPDIPILKQAKAEYANLQ